MNSRVVRTIIIVNVFLVTVFWEPANGRVCCTQPDVQLDVKCANGSAQLQWSTTQYVVFGFEITHKCNLTATCNSGTKNSLRPSEVQTGSTTYATDLTDPDFGSAVCWFWVGILDRLSMCSAQVVCSSESTTNITSTSLPSATTTDLVLPSSLSALSSSSVLSPSMSTSSLPSTPFSLSSTLILPSSRSVSSTAASTTTTTTTTTITTTATAAATAAADSTAATTEMASYPTASALPSSIASFEPQQDTSTDMYTLFLYITVGCAVILLLLLSVCIYCCCRKYKGKQSENYQIEDVCCEDPGELAKESDSETESLTNGNGIGDDVSITDDHPYMLRKILRLDVLSLDPSIFTADDDDGSVASHYRTDVDDGGVDCSHYCGSGGQCFQSNTSSSHHSSCSSVY